MRITSWDSLMNISERLFTVGWSKSLQIILIHKEMIKYMEETVTILRKQLSDIRSEIEWPKYLSHESRNISKSNENWFENVFSFNFNIRLVLRSFQNFQLKYALSYSKKKFSNSVVHQFFFIRKIILMLIYKNHRIVISWRSSASEWLFNDVQLSTERYWKKK